MAPTRITRATIVSHLHELVELMTLEEGSPQAFRVRAYENAIRGLEELNGDPAGMTAAELADVKGIGKSTAAKIRELIDTGSIARLDQLREKYPPGFVRLARIPGLGPKTLIMLRDRLGVASLEDLRAAIEKQQLRELPGLGAKSEEKIARAIERLGLHGKDRRTPIAEAMTVARGVVSALEALAGTGAVRYCGSLRRLADDIGDIDVVVTSTRPGPIMEAFVELPLVGEVLAHGETKSAIVTPAGLQVDLRVVERSQLGAAELYFTGSKAHNIELRQRALDRGWTLNEYALSEVDGGAVVASRTEEDIYARLDLPWIPPEMREGLGEIAAAAAGELPQAVRVKDLKGDLHVHSDWSGDGRSSMAEMMDEAARRGLKYVALTDHGEDLTINGLSRERMLEQRRLLEPIREAHPGMHIFHGSELNIGPGGGLDYDEDFLLGFDYCVASVHSHFDLTQGEQTKRVLAAIAHPAVNAIGHLTGRMIGRRPGIEVDIDAVFEAAAATGTAIEINGHLERLDLPADLQRRAAGTGVVFVIDTDAHHVTEFDNLSWGAAAARRGWVDRGSVANTWSSSKLRAWVERKRTR